MSKFYDVEVLTKIRVKVHGPAGARAVAEWVTDAMAVDVTRMPIAVSSAEVLSSEPRL